MSALFHWDLELAARYAKFIPRHNWCIKHKTRKHTFFINLFYLWPFSKKKRNSLFRVRLPLFFIRGICKKSSAFFEMLSYAPILWIFLSSLFFSKLVCSLFWIYTPFSVSVFYSSSCTCVCFTTLHGIIRRFDFHFSLSTFILHHISRQSTQQSSHDGI